MRPPTGYYRNLLKDYFPEVRIAFSHTPIYGCLSVDSTNVLKVLDASSDPYAKFYADGLRDGELLSIVEAGQERTYANNGELYFTS